MLIQWSDEDQVYVVTLPEFGRDGKTHADTYEKAAKKGREVLELLMETYQAEGWPLPEPQQFLCEAEGAPGESLEKNVG
jgi:predicted RNase H-like HicB family nuclease